jgi:predicted metalloprotease with PDZ domain
MLVTTPLPPGSGPLPFEPVEVSALCIRLTEEQGALARAGLADNDQVVAIDGCEFLGSEELSALRARLNRDPTLERLTLTVRRGADQWFEVVIAKALLLDRRMAGGTFEAATLDR